MNMSNRIISAHRAILALCIALGGTQVTATGVAELRKALPKCVIDH